MMISEEFLLIPVTLVLPVLVFFLYRWIRPKFPVRVNCWFCGADTRVPYGNKNCWDCPSCEQYNGFSKDGDYNKKIPAQYDDNLNHQVACESEEYIGRGDVLCPRCSQDQRLKIRQLADFVPLDPSRFDEEMAIYEKHVEKLYPLCEQCQRTVNQILDRQDNLLRYKLQAAYMERSQSAETSQSQEVIDPVITNIKFKNLWTVLDVIALLCSLIVAVSGTPTVNSHYLGTGLVFTCLGQIQKMTTDLSWDAGVMGLLSCLLVKFVYGKNRLLVRADIGSIILWIVSLTLQSRFLDDLHIPGFVHYIALIALPCYVINFVVSAACLFVKRTPKQAPPGRFKRLSLDSSKSSSKMSNTSDTSQFLSVSQVGDADDDQPINSSEEPSHLNDTVSELGSFSLGTASKRRDTRGGVFDTSFAKANQAPSSLSMSSVPRLLKERRPLISPAKLNVNGFQRTSPSKLAHSMFKPSQATPLSDRQKFSVNRGPCLQPPSENLFRMTSHAAFPCSQSDNLSTYSGAAFTEPASRFRHPVHHLDDFDDRFSQKSYSSQKSSMCPVDSTTHADLAAEKVPFWKTSGFIGFAMGASMVGNLFFLYTAFMQKS